MGSTELGIRADGVYTKFEGELDELLRLVDIIKDKLKGEYKTELKDLLLEIDKIYDTIAIAINAFVKIPYKDPDFNKLFAGKKANFEKQYKLDKESVGFRCDEVKKKLDKMTKPNILQSLLDKFSKRGTSSSEAMLQLENHIQRWYVSDKDVYGNLAELQKILLLGLDEINDTLRTEGQEQAEAKLQLFLKKSNQHFDKIKVLRSKLSNISKNL